MRRDQRGVALPSPVILLSVVAVLLAAVAWVATRHSGDNGQADLTASAPVSSTAPSLASSTASSTVPSTASRPGVTPSAKPAKPKPKPPAVKKSSVKVVVYNNTHITGLAAQVGEKAKQAGWDFAGSGNWHGTIPASTIYYGKGLKPAAKELGHDLGITRTYPADTGAGGMLPGGLTVILLGPAG